MVMFHAKGCDGNHRSPRLAQVNLTYTTVTRVNEYLEGNSDQFDFQGCTRILMYAATTVDKYEYGGTPTTLEHSCALIPCLEDNIYVHQFQTNYSMCSFL